MKNIINSIKSGYLTVGQKIGAFKAAPSNTQSQIALFAFGVTVLAIGLANGAIAQDDTIEDNYTVYNDTQIAGALTAVLTYIEGSFGALVMVASGLGAILSSAFGQYRAALGCLVVAVGSFILRSIMSTFFNVASLESFDRGQ